MHNSGETRYIVESVYYPRSGDHIHRICHPFRHEQM